MPGVNPHFLLVIVIKCQNACCWVNHTDTGSQVAMSMKSMSTSNGTPANGEKYVRLIRLNNAGGRLRWFSVMFWRTSSPRIWYGPWVTSGVSMQTPSESSSVLEFVLSVVLLMMLDMALGLYEVISEIRLVVAGAFVREGCPVLPPFFPGPGAPLKLLLGPLGAPFAKG